MKLDNMTPNIKWKGYVNIVTDEEKSYLNRFQVSF